MKGITAPTNTQVKNEPKDDYPGLEAILKTARKMKPFLSTDLEQAHRALDSMLPLGTFDRTREILHGRMEQDLVKAIAKWRADNWLLPVEKETEFPYARTRNLFDPLVKYGNLWLRRYYDSGFKYDGEGESIGFPQYMENCARANAVEMIDLAIKGVPQWWKADETLLEKMKAENAELKKAYANSEFDRHEEVLKTYYSDGYMITGRFRAFKIYSKEQQRLLEAYEANPNADTKKELLQHVYKHGQLIRDCPKEDSYVKKKEEVKKVVKKVQIGSVMDSMNV
jgi:D-ribose pyranose/furanose isomerase RbsD